MLQTLSGEDWIHDDPFARQASQLLLLLNRTSLPVIIYRGLHERLSVLLQDP